jgi:hypothetical protein
MAKTVSNQEMEGMILKFRNALGRDLTPEECKYLKLSSVIIPEDKNSRPHRWVKITPTVSYQTVDWFGEQIF